MTQAGSCEELEPLRIVLKAAERDWRAAAWWLMSRYPDEYAGVTHLPIGSRKAAWMEAASWLERHRSNEYAPAMDDLFGASSGTDKL